MKNEFRNNKTKLHINMCIKKIIIYALYTICAIAMLYAGTKLLKKKYIENKQENGIKKLQLEIKHNVRTENEEKETEKAEDVDEAKEKVILAEYTTLYEQNNDLYGWIKIRGVDTQIEEGYPVMFTPGEVENHNFYENKNYEKEECKSGSIWIDGRTAEDTENIIIYGHNMKNRSMFGCLKYYRDDIEYYKNHKYIEFDTLYEKQIFEIISVSKAVVYYEEDGINPPKGEYLFYDHIELNTKKEFDDYVKFAKENAYYNIEATAEYGDQLITLCTCDYFTENARLLIIAKKI